MKSVLLLSVKRRHFKSKNAFSFIQMHLNDFPYFFFHSADNASGTLIPKDKIFPSLNITSYLLEILNFHPENWNFLLRH